jgi:cytochrome c peroxidase
VNVTEVPYDRKPGQQPALSSAEILDVVAFLKTLDDGYELSPSERRGAEERRPNR